VQLGLERTTQAAARAAGLISEATAWGLDCASWRAHLNQLTWPEVLRQVALAAGWGPRRCRPARRGVADEHGAAAGEDVVEGENGALTFRWPSRFAPNPAMGEHTMKEACWKVLAGMVSSEADVAAAARHGLPVREISRRIESGGYRSGKIVEGSVAGALSRDSLFAYVAPGVYALQVRCSLQPVNAASCPRRQLHGNTSYAFSSSPCDLAWRCTCLLFCRLPDVQQWGFRMGECANASALGS
jgi:hypothetical protein